MSRYLIAGNWKLNPQTLEEAKKIAAAYKKIAPELKHTETVICPPFPFIQALTPSKPVKNMSMGAQSAAKEVSGSHTGLVSATMLREVGAEYIIVGHSEERKRGDTDEVVNARLQAVLAAGLTAIVCVGEEKRDSDGAYMQELKSQISTTLANVTAASAKKIVIAYEPVWAIGAPEPMKSEDIYETSLFVKKVVADILTPEAGIKIPVLYGGAVNAANAAEIVRIGQVDGLLVGRESINPSGFVELLKVVDSLGKK